MEWGSDIVFSPMVNRHVSGGMSCPLGRLHFHGPLILARKMQRLKCSGLRSVCSDCSVQRRRFDSQLIHGDTMAWLIIVLCFSACLAFVIHSIRVSASNECLDSQEEELIKNLKRSVRLNRIRKFRGKIFSKRRVSVKRSEKSVPRALKHVHLLTY